MIPISIVRACLALQASVLLACSSSFTSHAAETPSVILAESRFDEAANGQHGWSAITLEPWDAPFTTRSTSRSESGGVPGSGRYLRIGETSGDGRNLFFTAAQHFLGDQRRAYGGRLEFDLLQQATSRLINGYVVALHSPARRLIYHSGRQPDGQWWRYVVPLHESGAWFDAITRERATAEDLTDVLGDLTRLTILAEYSHDGFEETHLDNVELYGAPSGPETPELLAARYTGVTITGEVGRTYRIEFTPALAEPPAWQALTNLILSHSPFFWLDPDSAGAANRFYRATRVD